MATDNIIRNDLSLTADYQTFSQEELVNEMSATRKAIAYYLRRLLAVEEKIDMFTLKRNNAGKRSKHDAERGDGKNDRLRHRLSRR